MKANEHVEPGHHSEPYGVMQSPIKRIVINQPNYIPWRGYFDLIGDADLFLFHDDVNYTKQDWRNRNRIKTQKGTIWLTVPVVKTPSDTQIKDIYIDYDHPWVAAHQKALTAAYGKAPYFESYAQEFFDILEQRHERLLDLNVDTTKFIMRSFQISTPTGFVSEFKLSGTKTTKLVQILRACAGHDYLSGPAAKAYLDQDMFMRAGLGLAWKGYEYAPYPQLWGAFEPQVTALDLLFNCGPNALALLKSRVNHERALEPKNSENR
ncbi:MAG: WbqC family protein [Pseudomonadota bacterium]|nr:WbqC family protein [Pseudomonadota bacterium]